MIGSGLPWRDVRTAVLPHLREVQEIDGVTKASVQLKPGLIRDTQGRVRYGKAMLVVIVDDPERIDQIRFEVGHLVGERVPVALMPA